MNGLAMNGSGIGEKGAAADGSGDEEAKKDRANEIMWTVSDRGGPIEIGAWGDLTSDRNPTSEEPAHEEVAEGLWGLVDS
jgi:hypothetical protein